MQTQRPRRQRNRISFSCTNCRQGKYRCDRRMPCSTCVRRDNQHTCQYEEAAVATSRYQSPNKKGAVASKCKSPSADPQLLTGRPYSKTPDLKKFGYSKLGANTTLAVLNELSRFDSATSTFHEDADKLMSISPSQNEKYLRLVRELPPRLYIYILVDIFFDHVNWQYSIVDRNYFMSQLAEYYEATPTIFSEYGADVSSDVFTFPSLLLQVVASTFQFLPLDYDRSLDDLCLGRSFDELAKSYSDFGIELLALFEKESLNLVSVQAGFLRVALLKSFGYVVEAYRMVSQVVGDAEEVGLNLEVDKSNTGSVEDTPARLWYHEMRRRVMVNLWLWDSQMGIVLGKPSNFSAEDWSVILPLDSPIPLDRSLTVPKARTHHERPTQFTHRFTEYKILSELPGIQKLVAGEFNRRDYAKVQQHQQKIRDHLQKLPPQFRFETPNTAWDVECPWLKPQREYFYSTTWLLLLVTYRYSMFNIPQSRTEVINAGIKVLQAQERHYRALSYQHHKLYALAFFTLEAATAILVVFIAFPSENVPLFETSLFHIKQSITRMKEIQGTNPFARPAAELLETLLVRAENIQKDSKSATPQRPDEKDPPTLQYSSSDEYKPSFNGQNFRDYTPSQALDLVYSDSSSTPPNFDFTCGGLIGPYGPTATVLDNNFMMETDTWDPMILLDRADMMGGGNDVTNGFGAAGYGQDIYQ